MDHVTSISKDRMKVAFCTHVSDDWYYSVGADKLIKSIKYFHPEIDTYCFGTKELEQLFSLHPNVNWNTVHPFVTAQLIENYDMVVHFDADSMIVGKLDELLDTSNLEYEMLGVRNNNDYNKAGKDSFITNQGQDPQTYLNAGLVAITSKDVVEEWMHKNILYANSLPFQEQSVLNEISINRKTKILDPLESSVYYGISNLYGDITHWDSWKKIEASGDDLILNSKVVKVLHHGGGHNANKLDFGLFNEDVRHKLLQIYGYRN
jgi:hypothetical protein